MRRNWFASLCLLGATCGLAQTPSSDVAVIRIDRLVIQSDDLPTPDRDAVVQSFEHQQYKLAEVAPRIRFALRERGYHFASAEISQVPDRTTNTVVLAVRAGNQYHLGEIHFVHNTVFSAGQLRQAYPLKAGDVFNAAKVGAGMQAVQKLYADRGYADCVQEPTPVIRSDVRAIDLNIDLDEGRLQASR